MLDAYSKTLSLMSYRNTGNRIKVCWLLSISNLKMMVNRFYLETLSVEGKFDDG